MFVSLQNFHVETLTLVVVVLGGGNTGDRLCHRGELDQSLTKKRLQRGLLSLLLCQNTARRKPFLTQNMVSHQTWNLPAFDLGLSDARNVRINF